MKTTLKLKHSTRLYVLDHLNDYQEALKSLQADLGGGLTEAEIFVRKELLFVQRLKLEAIIDKESYDN